MSVTPEAFFLPAAPVADGAPGHRFCVFYPAQGPALRGMVLYIHPFAEEMNKARRMAALQSRALAELGYAVLQIDLLGCGDSSGDFGDATWQRWVCDVVQGCHWLRERCNAMTAPADSAPLWLWGLRAGCLLAAEAARQLDTPCHFLFWQPPNAGRPLLQQFLRLKAAADLHGGHAKAVMVSLRQQLSEGHAVEVAGYQFAAQLASALEHSVLMPPPSTTPGRRLEWLELSSRTDAALNPASSQTIANWQQCGFEVGSQVVRGPAFWQTSEIEVAPALLDATATVIQARRPSCAPDALAYRASPEVLAA